MIHRHKTMLKMAPPVATGALAALLLVHILMKAIGETAVTLESCGGMW